MIPYPAAAMQVPETSKRHLAVQNWDRWSYTPGQDADVAFVDGDSNVPLPRNDGEVRAPVVESGLQVNAVLSWSLS